MATARVNGIDLYYEELGHGPALIVAHGLMGSVATMPLFGERIDLIAERGVHVIAYDARGHGRSGYTRRPRDYTWSALASDMLGLIRALGLERASVYGGSMGAGTALRLALDHPAAVERLILQSPPPTGPRLKPFRGVFGALALSFSIFGPTLTGRLAAAMPSRENAEFDIAGYLGAQRREAIVPAIRGLLLKGERIPTHRYPEIKQPTLILTHPDDALHPLASGEVLHERLLHARLAVAPTRDYWASDPGGLARLVAAFVRGEPVDPSLVRAHEAEGAVAAGALRD
jgi:pimeloyl-ACP methyl ester carboxylesterase